MLAPRPLPILIDVDNVVADFTGRYLDIMRQQGVEPILDRMLEWDLSTWFAPEHHELARSMTRRVDPLDLALMPGAVEGVKMLSDRWEVRFVTAPMSDHPTWMHHRVEWLKRHFHWIPEPLFTSEKWLVTGLTLVDDKPSTCIEWSLSQRRTSLIWHQPYNEDVPHPRVRTWQDVYNVVAASEGEV